MVTSDSRHFGRLFESFMEHSPALWWMKDSTGCYVFVNPSFAQFWDLSPEDIVGKRDENFMPAETAQQLRANDASVLQSNQAIHIHETITGPRDTRIFLTSKFPFTEDGENYVGGIAFDVTPRVRLEHELETARDKALESEALKRAFISSIQHEIRTPLAGIIGMNELLLMSAVNEEQEQLAETIQQSSAALLAVLNDVLDLSKIESGKFGLSKVPFSVKFVAQESVRLVAAAARHKGLKLDLQIDPSLPDLVIGDPDRLRQLLLNLLANAIKFTLRGGISASVKLIEDNEETAIVRFSLSDTGIGIEPEKVPYLFLPFWQADMSDTRRYGGPGLGLPLCKYIAERMGSQGIHVTSEPKKGSTFTFDIPFPKRVDSVPPSQREAEVLIVEDNSTLLAVTASQFANLGIFTDAVTTSDEALKLLGSKAYNLILCERLFDGSHAKELIAKVREIETKNGWTRTPIIVMSASPSEEDRSEHLSQGADDYVGKPLSAEQLWRLVNIWRVA
jgi:two-component system, sensor histidine kinase and response regulator